MGLARIPLLALATAIIVLLLLGPGAASADLLCKANESPCAAENRWPVGTVFTAGIEPEFMEMEVAFKAAWEFRCKESFWEGELKEISTKAGVAATVRGMSESFAKCSVVGGGSCNGALAQELGEEGKWYADSESAGNGYASETLPFAHKIQIFCGTVSCTWTLSESKESTHAYQGGTPAIETWSWRYLTTFGPEGACGSEMTMAGERILVASGALNVFWTT